MVGIFLLFIGVVTLLFLFSSNNSASTGVWLSILGRAFGWGAYLFPIGLFTVGLWLVLRHFERIPQVSLERVIGVILLYLLFLVMLHLSLDAPDRETSFALAAEAKGGGYVGAVILELLVGTLGVAGTLIAMLSWGLSYGTHSGRPVVDLFARSAMFLHQDWFADRLDVHTRRKVPSRLGKWRVTRRGVAQTLLHRATPARSGGHLLPAG
jgi:hypothetical protein